MAQRFLLLLLPGAFILGGMFLLFGQKKQYVQLPQKPVERDSLPRTGASYTNYPGFCFSEDRLGDGPAVRGDLLLFGRPRGSKGVVIRGALYRLRGPVPEENFLEISGGRGFRDVRSLPLPKTKTWRRVPFRSQMPRRARWNSPGEFRFQFGDGVFAQSCSWKFRF